jgi:hypothetical protein
MRTPKEVKRLTLISTTKNIFYVRPIGDHPSTVADKKLIRKIIKTHMPDFYKKHSLNRKTWKFYKSQYRIIIANNAVKHIFKYD